MDVHNARVLLTGATGGIGQHLAQHLAKRGARVALVGRRAGALTELCRMLSEDGCDAIPVTADVSSLQGVASAINQVHRRWGGVDILVNNAGLANFGEFATVDPVALEALLRTNVIGPMLLTRAVLPGMLQQQRGQIVNIGSIFGSIGFAYFAPYSTSKFAMRGFSEALRREVHGRGVEVTYVAPRATKTALNSDAVYRMAAAVKMNLDEPECVAERIVEAIVKGKKDCYLGFPESLFVRINALLPRLVDAALRKQNRVMRKFAQDTT